MRIVFKNSLLIFLLFVLSGCTKMEPPKRVLDQKEDSNVIEQEKSVTSNDYGFPTIEEKLQSQSKVKKFSNQAELADFMENNQSADSFAYSIPRMSFGASVFDGDVVYLDEFFSDEIESLSELTKEFENSSGAASDDYSKTNVQVEGVDEADIIKTDGEYIYAVSRNNLFIVRAYPVDNAEVVAKIEFKLRPNDIYINGDRLIVYGTDGAIVSTDLYNTFKRKNSFTFLKIFDISDRKNPKQLRDMDFEGNYVDSRMIGDYIYFITSNYAYYIEDETVIPRIIEDGVVANECLENTRCVMPDVYYFDTMYDSYNFTSINVIDVKNEKEPIKNEIYLMNNSQNIYVSQENIFITYTKYVSEYELVMEVMRELVFPVLGDRDKERIAKIESVENYILSSSEKRNKIFSIVTRYTESLSNDDKKLFEKKLEDAVKNKYKDISKELEKTIIHKIGISGNNVEYKTSGEVTGYVLNQFSMDESDGYFRIATTKNSAWSNYLDDYDLKESYSNLYVLDEDLKVVGNIENLAPDEKIYSVRFMQERAYLVTFKQMDPLFVIDLKDPFNPKVLGELKIPGYSDYLHPYNEDILIGLGKDTGTTEWGGVKTEGLKLSLFDVSDVANPREVDTYLIGDSGSESIALKDHKAFLFSLKKNLLSIPVSVRESIDNNNWGDIVFRTAFVFNVTEDGFDLEGKINHHEEGEMSLNDYWGGYSYFNDTVKRSLYIGDYIYTFSNNMIKVNSLKNLDLVKDIVLKKDEGMDDDFKIVN